MSHFLVHQLLTASASGTPDALAVVDPKTSLTYAELERESLRTTTALADLGVRPGDLVGISLEKTAAAVACVYGILRRGAAYVPIDPAMPRERVARILRHTEMRTVITSADKLASFAEARADAPLLSRALVASGEQRGAATEGLHVAELGGFEPDARASRDVTEGYLAYVLHTSGSTGQPKGVAITHRNCLAFVEPAAARFDIGPADRLACQAPLHFDLSVFDLYCAALKGAGVVIFPEYFSAFPKKMAQAIGAHGITVWNSVVSALALLVDKGRLGEHARDTLRAVIFSGERMPIPLLGRLRELLPHARLYNVYGQTEANSSLVHEIREVPSDPRAALPLGEPLPNFEVFLLAEDGEALEGLGATGELCVRAATVASGAYYRDEERSRMKFVADPVSRGSGMRVYRTGDLVERSMTGDLYFVGRRDDMVKTRGFRVELGEVEVALEQIAGVEEVAVVAIPDPSVGYELRAFLRLAEGAALTPAALTASLSDRVPSYMIPAKMEIVSELPRTSTGKIDKRALAAVGESGA